MNKISYALTSIVLLSLFLIPVHGVAGNNDNGIVKVSRSLDSSINELDIAVGIDVTYIQGSPAGMVIEGSQKAIDQLKSYTKGDKLILHRDKPDLPQNSSNNDLKITVTAPEIYDFEISVGSSLRTDRLSSTSKVEVDASTGSSFTIGKIVAPKTSIDISTGAAGTISELCSDKVSIDVSTGSALTVSGSGEKISIDASTGSSVDASGFKAQTAKIDASIGATVRFNSSASKVESALGATVVNVAK